ncbi:MAG: hypothetical protein WBV94_19080 [Blastocatellia bacterium]
MEGLFETGLLRLVSPTSQMQSWELPHSHHAPFGFIWPANATIADGVVTLFEAVENHMGSVKMQITANNNLTFIRLFSFDSVW